MWRLGTCWFADGYRGGVLALVRAGVPFEWAESFSPAERAERAGWLRAAGAAAKET